MLGKLSLLCAFCLLNSLIATAQEHKHFGVANEQAHEQCAHTSIHEHRMQNDPGYAQEQLLREENLAQLVAQYEAGLMPKTDEILTIPVVVHIIHKGEAYGTGTNITDEQVYSAINGLNEDFRKMTGTWGDGDGVDVGVEFCLAQRDPDGNTHSGINRVSGCSVSLYCDQGITAGQGQGASETAVKNVSRWPNQQYYNVWVVTEIENNNGGAGIQGYAYFPTTSTVDGTVLLYNAFGTVGTLKTYTNRNRTLTHELGHAFALFHTFQGGVCSETNCNLEGDRVCDTPPTTLNSNCNSAACSGAQQVENYMDYTSQTCKDMFTLGQKDRMRLSIQNSRPNLLLSDACIPMTTVLADAAITEIKKPEGGSCSNLIQPVCSLSNAGSTALSAATIQYKTSGSWQSHNWTGLLGPGQSVNIILPEYNGGWGTKVLDIRVINPNGNADANASNNMVSKAYHAVENGNSLTLSLTLDNLGSQNTWLVRDANGNNMYSGGPYTNFDTGTVYNIPICLADGCFEFEINDSGNNGMCCFSGEGGYVLSDENGTELAAGTAFGSQDITGFCLESEGTGPVPPTANFSASQTQICVGGSITFSNSSTGQIDNFVWQFPGGSPSSANVANPGTITYNLPGTYHAQLTVSNINGSDVETKSNYITVLANQTWYADNDGDGYGDSDVSMVSCTAPGGYVGNAQDCDDNNASDWNSCYDCNGTMNGNASLDNCGTCDENPANDCDSCESLQLTLMGLSNPACHEGNDGTIAIEVEASEAYTINWNNGSTTASLNGLSAGAYIATVTSNLCEKSIEVTLTEPDPIQVNISDVQHVQCEQENTGALTFEVSGGTGPFTINALGQSISSGTYTGLAVGTYAITVIDANGCQAQAEVSIDQIPCDSLAETSLTTDYCDNLQIDFFENVYCTPIPAALQYTWKFSSLSANESWTFQTAQPYFEAAQISQIIPLHTYTLEIKGEHPDANSDYGPGCTVLFAIDSSTLIAGDCDNEELDPDTNIQCAEVQGSEQYEFRFEHLLSGERSYGYAGTDATVDLSTVEDLTEGELYLTDVRVKYRNVWGSHGGSCLIGIAKNVFVPTLPTTICENYLLNSKKDSLWLQPIQGAGVYAIEFSAAAFTTPVELQSAQPYFIPSQFANLPKGDTLQVRIKIEIDGAWTPWSETCNMAFASEIDTENEIKYTMNLLLYPNPTLSGNDVMARMQGAWVNVELSLRNLAGITLKKQRVNFSNMEAIALELPDIESGIYFITAVHGTSSLTKKLIVQ
jgi:PKD repeat protein